MLELKQWLVSPEYKRVKALTPEGLFQKEFMRDPMRSIRINPDVFYAPADGVVLYAKTDVGCRDAIIDVKGKKFTPQDLLDDYNYEENSLVVSIFMTQLDVHVNRVPTRGYVKERHRTPYLFTPNFSMVLEEDDIFKGRPKDDDAAYLFQNERRVTSVYNPDIKGEYYLIQVAEKDVDEILNWGEGEAFTQGQRFGIVRFGSQADVVIPLTGRAKFEIVAKENHHVEAGVDAIVRVIR